jgi:hypothetical protein
MVVLRQSRAQRVRVIDDITEDVVDINFECTQFADCCRRCAVRRAALAESATGKSLAAVNAAPGRSRCRLPEFA